MSYREVPMYVVVCDGCGDEHEDDEYAGWADRGDADARAEGDDWTATRGRHLCPACVAATISDPPDTIEKRHGEPGPNDVELPIEGGQS